MNFDLDYDYDNSSDNEDFEYQQFSLSSLDTLDHFLDIKGKAYHTHFIDNLTSGILYEFITQLSEGLFSSNSCPDWFIEEYNDLLISTLSIMERYLQYVYRLEVGDVTDTWYNFCYIHTPINKNARVGR